MLRTISLKAMTNPAPHTVSPVQPLQVRDWVIPYFEAFNRHDFDSVATLFSENGAIVPPFESAVVGRDSIVSYLQQEASHMILKPATYHLTEPSIEGTLARVVVEGRAQTSAFQVAVQWQFDFAAEGKIQRLQIQLLASLKALLNLRS